jgi:hypothetical protein
MRYQLLAAHGQLKDPHLGQKLEPSHSPEKLIGATGFRHGNNDAFGKIAGLSPVMLWREGVFFAPMLNTAHHVFTAKKKGKRADVFGDIHTDFLPELEGFTPKDMPDMMLYSTKGVPPVKMDDVFKEKVRIGITKNRKHFPWLYAEEKQKSAPEAESEGFFKQVSFSFSQAGWAFAFVAWIEEDAGEKLKDFVTHTPLATLGAERSMFHFEIEVCSTLPDFAPAFPALESDVVRMVLLSDAWADPEKVNQNCLFAHSETQEFRFLQSEVAGTTHYYRRGEKAQPSGSLTRSLQYRLFKRGSVFFCTEAQAKGLATLLNDPAGKETNGFRRIGYNAFAEVRSDIQTNFFQP